MRLPRQLHPRPSRIGMGLLVGLHLLALFAIAVSAFAGTAIFICLLGVTLLVISFAWSIWALKRAPQGIRLGRGGGLQVILKNETAWRHAQLLADTTVWEFAVVLRFRLDGGGEEGLPERWARTMLVAKDSLPTDDWRALCVWLRWREGAKRHPHPAADVSDSP